MLAVVGHGGLVTWRCFGDEQANGQISAAVADASRRMNGSGYAVGVSGNIDSAVADRLRDTITGRIEADIHPS